VPFLLVVATGCGSVTWGSRGAKHYPITAQVLETQTLDPCAVSLSTMQQTDATLDALSGSTTTNADLLKAVRKASKTARIQRDAAPSPLGAPATATPSILTTRFGAPTVSTDTWNLVGATPSPASGELAS